MTDDRLNELFERLRQEGPSTSPAEILGSLDKPGPAGNVPQKYTWIWWCSSAVLLLSVTAAFLLRTNNPAADSETVSKPILSATHPGEVDETPVDDENRPVNSASAVRLFPPDDTLHPQQPASLPLAELFTEPEKAFTDILQPAGIKMPDEEKPAAAAPPETPRPAAPESPLEQDLLFILDTARSYNSVVKYRMDDPDCYLQLYYGYAVISYKLRGRSYYASGKIHRQEAQKVDGVDYTVFAFQQDNSVAGLGFGNRVFFGFREMEKGIFEVVLFSQPWAAGTLFRSHAATYRERKALVERSDSQKK
jgi:hypothetical protein